MSKQKPLPGIVIAAVPERADISVKQFELDSSGRARRQFKFWLDAARPIEAVIGDRLDSLKRRRQFAPTIRNSLKLFFSLLAGDTSILENLFPEIVRAIRAEAIADYTRQQPASADFEALIHDLAHHLDNRLDAVEQTVSIAPQAPHSGLQPVMGQTPQNASNGANMANQGTIGMQPVAGGPTQLNVPQFAAPSPDEDDLGIELTVTKAEHAGSEATANFLNSLMALQGS